MPTQTKVYFVPSKEGVFHIACGKELVEIHVVAQESILIPGGAAKDESSIPAHVPTGILKPIDRPIRTLSVSKGVGSYEKMDVDFASLIIGDAISSRGSSGVIGLPIGKGVAVDIHDLARLRAEVGGKGSGLDLAIGFGTQFKK